MKEKTVGIFCPRKNKRIPLWKCPNRIKGSQLDGKIYLTVLVNCENCQF